jgi:hypothetical protein
MTRSATAFARGAQHRHEADAGDDRSTTNQQFESVLEQAGLLAPARLGGTRSAGDVAERDGWALAGASGRGTGPGPPPRMGPRRVRNPRVIPLRPRGVSGVCSVPCVGRTQE